MQVPGWKKKRKENVALFRSQRFEKEARESVKSREKKDFKSLTNESHVVSLLIGGTAREKIARFEDERGDEGSLRVTVYDLIVFRKGGGFPEWAGIMLSF